MDANGAMTSITPPRIKKIPSATANVPEARIMSAVRMSVMVDLSGS
jgi:hypothetical protein